ncbi:MAG: ABC transporter ATP-binding protein [Candidatus Acetothermia bacterium]|jgi:multiple sugar transport system ATP-binding protein|nr:ABC transporter ATP-binding protein [Candidatus Acetothermia bacterium]
MPEITIRSLTKRFGKVIAVHSLDLSIASGEFVTLLGPSGCGKTTTLRCLAGLEEPDQGEVFIGERCVFSSVREVMVPPGGRGIGMVFQSYALWPHMMVSQNVAFGLAKKGFGKQEIKRRVREVLDLLGLGGLERRFPNELSGGQQQRVALARAVVVQPEILLFDEPLSNLDAKLRMTLRAELKRLHTEIGATTVYVTHDQLEALTLSTRIAVMKDGVVQQMGTPQEVYHFPSNLFVAEFMGNPTTNLFPAVVASAGPPASVALKWNPDVPLLLPDSKALPEGAEVVVNVRPEDMGFSVEPRAGYLPATVYATLPTGAECITYGRLTPGGEEVVLKGPGEEHACLGPNQPFWLGLKRGNVFDAREGTLITSFGFSPQKGGA